MENSFSKTVPTMKVNSEVARSLAQDLNLLNHSTVNIRANFSMDSIMAKVSWKWKTIIYTMDTFVKICGMVWVNCVNWARISTTRANGIWINDTAVVCKSFQMALCMKVIGYRIEDKAMVKSDIWTLQNTRCNYFNVTSAHCFFFNVS